VGGPGLRRRDRRAADVVIVLVASITRVDQHVLTWIVDHRVSFLNPLLVGITYLATGGTIWVALAVLIAWRTRRPILPTGVLAAVCVWGADGISHLLKATTDRPRPYVALPHLHTLISRPTSASFPSSHATTAFAGAVVLSFLLPRLWPLFLAAAALVAFSRVYVGVHYPSDVIAGAATGVIFAALIILLATKTRLGARIEPTKQRGIAWL
jgi:undecaprenyl-diphosphatase